MNLFYHLLITAVCEPKKCAQMMGLPCQCGIGIPYATDLWRTASCLFFTPAYFFLSSTMVGIKFGSQKLNVNMIINENQVDKQTKQEMARYRHDV